MWLALVVILVLAVWYYGRPPRCLAHLPSLPTLPFIGNAYMLIGKQMDICGLLQKLSVINQQNNYLPFCFMCGPCPVVVLNDAVEARIASNAFLNKPRLYEYSDSFMGNGLITASAEVWKRNIKKLGSFFSSSTVLKYQTVFNTQARKVVDILKSKVGEDSVAFMDSFKNVTLEAIFQLGLGQVTNIDKKNVETYCAATGEMMKLYSERTLNVLYYPDFIYQFTASHRRLNELTNLTNEISEAIIKTRRMERKAQKTQKCGQPHFKSYLDFFLELEDMNEHFNNRQIMSEINTILLAGYETLASTTLFAILLLARNPTAQKKLYQEIIEVFGESKRDVTNEDCDRCVYTEAVVNEALRLYPAAPLLLRVADRDLKLESCTIPKGAVCALNLWGVGRSRRQWGEDADSLRPERWLAPTTANAQLTFGVGSRVCIGKKYAVSFMKIILIHCIRELEFDADDTEVLLKFALTMRPADENSLRIQLR